MAEFERHIIQDCILRDLTQDIEVPVSRFEVVYALDEIPTMQIVPALGRDLFNKVDNDFNKMRERDEVELILTIDGDEKLLMSGIVAALSASDNAGVFKRTVSAVISVKHKAVLLATNPPMSVLFTGDKAATLTELNRRKKDKYFTSNIAGGTGAQFTAVSQFIADTVKAGIGKDPAAIYKAVIESVAKDWNIAAEDIEALIKLQGNTEITFDLASNSFIEEMANIWVRAWGNSSMWQATVRACNNIFLRIIPFNTGFYIGQPMAAVRTPNVQLKSTEYIELKQSVVDNLAEPVDGVVIRDPLDLLGRDFNLDNRAFPPVDKNSKGKYYHFMDFPAWAKPFANEFYNATQNIKKNKVAAQRKDPEIQDKEDYYNRVSTRVAKAVYSQMREKKLVVSITLPYRDDLMPGTLIQLENSGAFDLSFFGGATYFGMIQGMKIIGDMTQASGKLNTFLDIVNIRNEEDNNDDDLTFEDHPIFSNGTWKAIDLFGDEV
jgi:hypothetical protein